MLTLKKELFERLMLVWKVTLIQFMSRVPHFSFQYFKALYKYFGFAIPIKHIILRAFELCSYFPARLKADDQCKPVSLLFIHVPCISCATPPPYFSGLLSSINDSPIATSLIKVHFIGPTILVRILSNRNGEQLLEPERSPWYANAEAPSFMSRTGHMIREHQFSTYLSRWRVIVGDKWRQISEGTNILAMKELLLNVTKNEIKRDQRLRPNIQYRVIYIQKYNQR